MIHRALARTAGYLLLAGGSCWADLTRGDHPGLRRRLSNLAVIALSGLVLMVLAGSVVQGNGGPL